MKWASRGLPREWLQPRGPERWKSDAALAAVALVAAPLGIPASAYVRGDIAWGAVGALLVAGVLSAWNARRYYLRASSARRAADAETTKLPR